MTGCFNSPSFLRLYHWTGLLCGSPEVSFHIMDGEDWTEAGVTWRKYDGTYYWDDGGRVPSMSVGNFEGDQSSSPIEVNLTAAIQKWIDDNNAGTTSNSLELMMVASTWGIEESSSKFVNLCSTEATGVIQPTLRSHTTGEAMALHQPYYLSPTDGHSVWNLTGDNLSGNTTPTLTWDASISWTGDMLMQVATDRNTET